MANLSDLIRARTDQIELHEQNLEKGRIYSFSPGTEYMNFLTGVCWVAPASGMAKIEIWGAGGSGARMCCCGGGIPGNPGAYARKCICVVAGCIVCAYVGRSCNNADTLCFRGCSEATCLCWFGRTRSGAAEDGCMCAQGGRGGTTFCSTTPSIYCCFRANGFCTSRHNNNWCGLICNYGTSTGTAGCAEAYGGDVNYRGGFSCTTNHGCHPQCPCSYQYHVAVPPGLFAEEGAVVTYGTEGDNGFSEWSGMGIHQFIHTLNALNREPQRGTPWASCFNGTRSCGCYDVQGCMPYIPHGIGGLPAVPCPQVRDNGIRGGLGNVRITFYQKD